MNKPTITIENNQIVILSDKKLSSSIINEFTALTIVSEDDLFGYEYRIDLYPSQAFVLFCVLKKALKSFEIDNETLISIQEKAKPVPLPSVEIRNDQQVFLTIPDIPTYRQIQKSFGFYHKSLHFYTVPIGRLFEVVRLIKTWNHPFLPNFIMDSTFREKAFCPIKKIKEIEDLFSVSLTDLISVLHAWNIKIDGFEKLKIETAADILLHRPRRYSDRRKIVLATHAKFRQPAYIEGTILSGKQSADKKRFSIQFQSGDREYGVDFWGGTYKLSGLTNGDKIVVLGSITGKDKIQGTELLTFPEIAALPVAPEYPRSPTNRITNKVLINAVYELLLRLDGSDLCSYLNYEGWGFWESLLSLHFPNTEDDYQKAIDTLAFLELVFLQLLFKHKRETEGIQTGVSKKAQKTDHAKKILQSLPFALTKGQQNAVDEIFKRLDSEKAEEILLSAETGSGKTICAQLACLYTVDAGQQAVLAAPTSVLARQLYDTFVVLIDKLENKPSIVFVTSDLSTAEKREIDERVRQGKVDLIVGTHSVFNMEYKNLGFVCIDEQQKFGTTQRDKLIYNARKDKKRPDVLTQTATPIPRSTALAFYGDVDLITIEDRPKDRKDIKTFWIKEDPKEFLTDILSPVWSKIGEEIKEGNQIFIINAAVDDNEVERLSVNETAKILKATHPEYKIELVHGKLSKETQDKRVERFRNKKCDILVASSIVEVGIDVPSATIVVILDANCFGASTLHQIRGRVGRSEKQGYCYLVSENTSKQAETRLSSLVESNNGFEIALVDLSTRRQGDVLGVKQSGESSLRFSDLINHSELISMAQEEAERIWDSNNKKQALKDAMIFLKREDMEYDN